MPKNSDERIERFYKGNNSAALATVSSAVVVTKSYLSEN